jgi:hypothetical protein
VPFVSIGFQVWKRPTRGSPAPLPSVLPFIFRGIGDGHPIGQHDIRPRRWWTDSLVTGARDPTPAERFAARRMEGLLRAARGQRRSGGVRSGNGAAEAASGPGIVLGH